MIQKRLLQMAGLYLVVGVAMGLYMGVTTKFTLAPVHAHLNLLGWASMAVMALIYRSYPDAAATTLAKTHFWLHAIFLPAFMLLLGLMLTGNPAVGPAVGITATLLGVGILAYVVNILRFVH